MRTENSRTCSECCDNGGEKGIALGTKILVRKEPPLLFTCPSCGSRGHRQESVGLQKLCDSVLGLHPSYSYLATCLTDKASGQQSCRLRQMLLETSDHADQRAEKHQAPRLRLPYPQDDRETLEEARLQKLLHRRRKVKNDSA